VLASCAFPPPSTEFSLSTAFRGVDAIPGWTPTAGLKTYTHDDLYSLVDGQADAFFAYRFKQVAVRRYKNAEGNLLNVEVWQLAAPEDAYGLFTSNLSGQPYAAGNDGMTVPGQRVAFWQSRYFVAVTSAKKVSDETLKSFTDELTRALPTGGDRPALLQRLPAEGRVARSELYFHQEISIQNEVWLGGQNLLGLSDKTGGMLAQYTLEGKKARLMLVEYSSAEEAAKALVALQNAGLDGFVAAKANGPWLTAVFGQASPSSADVLLQEALK
jgi:hypothetical protein